jgi:hypothetical protein
MHQTTVRFSAELWTDLAAEAETLGVSVAQFIREAALARLAYNAGRRGDSGWRSALRLAGADLDPPDALGLPSRAAAELAEAEAAFAAPSREPRPPADDRRRTGRDVQRGA